MPIIELWNVFEMRKYQCRVMINSVLSDSSIALTALEIADRIVAQFGCPMTARQVTASIAHISERLCVIDVIDGQPKKYRLCDKF